MISQALHYYQLENAISTVKEKIFSYNNSTSYVECKLMSLLLTIFLW